jgi:hypothetical protein
MDIEKPPPFIIYKGANTSCSSIKRKWKDLEAKQKYSCPGGPLYTIQENDWVDEQAIMK